MYGYQQYHSSENSFQFEQGQQERTILEITSGYAVAIDQFMLANPQFISALPDGEHSDEHNIDTVRQAVCDFGGTCFEITNGTFYVARDAFQKAIVASQAAVGLEAESSLADDAYPKPAFSIEDIALKSEELFSVGKVFVDTRCMVLCDVKILFNRPLLEQYAKLRAQDKEKPARDLLRDNGCAVRYGFMPYGDEFTVYVTRDKQAAAFF